MSRASAASIWRAGTMFSLTCVCKPCFWSDSVRFNGGTTPTKFHVQPQPEELHICNVKADLLPDEFTVVNIAFLLHVLRAPSNYSRWRSWGSYAVLAKFLRENWRSTDSILGKILHMLQLFLQGMEGLHPIEAADFAAKIAASPACDILSQRPGPRSAQVQISARSISSAHAAQWLEISGPTAL